MSASYSEQFSAGPPQGSRSAAKPKLAPMGGSVVHEVTSVGAISLFVLGVNVPYQGLHQALHHGVQAHATLG